MRSNRKQYSSCDGCRRSRVACNASQLGYRPGDSNWKSSCARCSRLKQPCSFQWISNAKRSHAAQPPICQPLTPITVQTESPQDLEFADQGQLDSLLTLWSNSFVRHSLEPVLNLAIGAQSCPLVTSSCSTANALGIGIFSTLDVWSTTSTEQRDSNHAREKSAEATKRNESVKRSLLAAAKAFTARWLPLILNQTDYQTGDVEEIIRSTWRAARNDMLRVMNRVSYQSVLTLFIFSQTPIPVGITKDEEENGISGLVCLHTALLQVQRLRERYDGRQFRGSEVGTWVNATAGPSSDPDSTERYLQLESRIYWAAVGWDTSTSLAYNVRASLTSGLKGACVEPVWLLVRAFLVGSFHPQTETWRTEGFKVTDEAARKIFSGAAVGSMYIWKNITSLKEALREGVDEDSLLLTWKSLLDAINVYRTSICPLLNTCERQLHYLNQQRRLCWFEVSLQHHLGILTMIDALKAAHRSDLLAQVLDLGQDTESEIFNVLRFGTDSTYTIRCPKDTTPATGLSEITNAPQSTITASLITIYPLVSRVVDSVALTKRAIDVKHSQGAINDEVYSYLNSVLTKALHQLPQYRQRATLFYGN
ncbi:hypothetical protein LZ32DRAFT_694437 [Colletotrichum eremochloae]|nr:hypothetical protein LZ32DRAFT_694437 [Colletotrichum eremochloae]